jgi:hypothetical protein
LSAASRLSWSRLLRIALIALAGLAIFDAALASIERGVLTRARNGLLRNTEGPSIADACERMLLSLPDADVRRAVVFVGASVTYGSNLEHAETLPAYFSRRMVEGDAARPVFNCAQPGGRPATGVPVAAAFGARPPAILLVELMVPIYAERSQPKPPPFSDEEVALVVEANARQRAILEEADLWPGVAARIESRLSRLARDHWRLYRLRGSLWIDETRIPNLLVWTLRRQVAAWGFLPKRFHGQTTNVGRLPWREAYVGGQRPSPSQHFRVPSVRLSEPDYEMLARVHALAEAAGVPVLFYEIPLNLPFQRAFELMDDVEIERLAEIRELLLTRMSADGLEVLEAPTMPDDGFLDKAHLTPGGSDVMAMHLVPAVRDLLAEPVAP